MNDLEEYEQLKKDQRKIKNKIRNIENTDDKKKLYHELDVIMRRKTKLRNRM